jgi:Fe-S cluster biosynthesis and repair protein YggX
MGDITEKEYNQLDLKKSLKYRKTAIMCCNRPECLKYKEPVLLDSEKGPFDFIHAKEIVEDIELIKYMPIKMVCPSCMVKMKEISSEFFKKEEQKYTFNVPKAPGDRGKDYYKDFSKQSWKSDPEAGKNATKMSKKDINRFNSL